MAEKTFNKLKIISIVLGLIHILGYIWFADDYFTDIYFGTFLKTSTGFALLIIPLIGSAASKFTLIRFGGIVLGSIGILNNFYLMYIDMAMPHFPNIVGLILRIVVLATLVIITHRIIKPHSKDVANHHK